MVERLDFRADIEVAVKVLSLSASDFRVLRFYEYENILKEIVAKFTTLGTKGINANWLWDSFKEPKFCIQLEYVPAILKQLISSEETVWFIAEDWPSTKQHGKFWLYEGKIAAIVDVLGEMYGCEYYLVSKKFEWLLCENHHDILMAVGQPMVEKLKLLAARHKTAQ